MFIVLTGNPNTGKTQLINLLKEEGFNTFNVDEFIQEIYEVNQIGYILISTHFGKEFTNGKKVDTKKLGNQILNNPVDAQRLKILIWPLIKSKLHYLKRRNPNMIVEMAIYKTDPLYFYNIFDYSIEITRSDKNLFSNDKSKFSRFYSKQSCFSPDFIIENDLDILKAYSTLKEIINNMHNNNNNK